MGDAMGDLKAKSITTRTGALDQLAATGTPDVVLTLLELARTDKSRSVKLCAAAAAADLLARHRGCAGQPVLDETLVEPILEALRTSDPADLPQLLLCYAVFPRPAVIQRLTRMLRDPRQTIRRGAAASLQRMALSSKAMEEGTGLREWVADAFGHRRLPVDAAVELIRLIGRAGWEVLRPVVQQATSRPGVVGEAAATTLEQLDARLNPAGWTGIWIDEGLDVMELGQPQRGRWCTVETVKLNGNQARIKGKAARRIWAPRRGETGVHEALQMGLRTWWKLTPDRAIGLIQTEDARLAEQADVVGVLLPMVDQISGAQAMRAAAILLVRTGDHQAAIDRLEKPLNGKRPRNDLFFLRALARRGLGDDAGARADLECYLSRAKKNEPWREEAEALLR